MSKAVDLPVLSVLRTETQSVQQLCEFNWHPGRFLSHSYPGSPASGNWLCPKIFSRSDQGQFENGHLQRWVWDTGHSYTEPVPKEWL